MTVNFDIAFVGHYTKDTIVTPQETTTVHGGAFRYGAYVVAQMGLKAAVVTTDMPLEVDKPIDFGLQDFCRKCIKCARECPSQAISHGNKEMFNGYERWIIDVEKCTQMRVGNQNGAGCGTCIKVCPWNKPNTPFHRLIGWVMRKVSFARRFAVLGDDLLGYGKPKPEWQWWLDLEEIDGELRIPKSRGKGKGLENWLERSDEGDRSKLTED